MPNANHTVPAYLRHLVACSVVSPHRLNPLEDVTYPVITQFLLVHLNPPHRFTIYPQMKLMWNPTLSFDARSEIPDIGLVNFRLDKPFIFRMGIESKMMMPIMATLPDAAMLENDMDVMAQLHVSFYQAEDQAKAAVRGDHLPRQRPLDYLLFVGPYWTHAMIGPFDDAQLTARTHKPSASADFDAAVANMRRLASPALRRKLYCLGSAESAKKLEEIVASTDNYAMEAMWEAFNYNQQL